MMKIMKLSLMIIAPAILLSACASTPKCDNDACYNRQISSVDNAKETEDQDQSRRAEYFRAEGNHRD